MTLARQLVIAISLMFFAMLVGVESINLGSARQHLQDQLESHAQDAATSIGLSLGILLSRGDYAIAETVINAAFDRGNYAYIEFVTLDKAEPVVARRMPNDLVVDYPDWLPRLFPLTGPTAESLVSSGWKQLGKVRVTSHPRFAYEQLWQTARNTLVWMVIIYAVALAILQLFLRNLLRPLTAIERAADSISRRDFVTISEKPRTRELVRVVDAMNLLSSKVRSAFESETARATALQHAAYMDTVSGTLNRRGFTEQFESRYVHDRKSFSGVLALMQLPNLAKLNDSLGQQRTDALLQAIGGVFAEAARAHAGLAGRWLGGTFVLAAAPGGADSEGSALLAGTLQRARAVLVEIGIPPDSVAMHMGAVHANAALPGLDALAKQAEEALQAAVDRGAAEPELRGVAEVVVDPNRQQSPIDIVRANISAGRLVLMGQPALAIPGGGVVHQEILARLPDEAGKQLVGAEFMPLVTRHKLSVDLDRAVILKLLTEAGKLKTKLDAIAINLAPESVADESFVAWLEGMLGSDVRSRLGLIFELSENGVMQNEAAAQRFAERITKRGAGFAIDHFGVHTESLALVQRLRPVYIKLSAVHTAKIASDTGTRFFVEAVVRAAGQLDVPVFGQRIEDAATVAVLEELGFGGYQGYVAGRPEAWPGK